METEPNMLKFLVSSSMKDNGKMAKGMAKDYCMIKNLVRLNTMVTFRKDTNQARE